MEKKEIEQKLQTLGNALEQLNGAISMHKKAPQEYKNYLRTAAIHSFEFSLELYWKVLKKILFYTGTKTTTPRETLQLAYQSALINDENLWIKMLQDRNITSHTYEETTAEEIFERIQNYYPIMSQTYENLVLYVKKMI